MRTISRHYQNSKLAQTIIDENSLIRDYGKYCSDKIQTSTKIDKKVKFPTNTDLEQNQPKHQEVNSSTISVSYFDFHKRSSSNH